jgi:hypothetical protein
MQFLNPLKASLQNVSQNHCLQICGTMPFGGELRMFRRTYCFRLQSGCYIYIDLLEQITVHVKGLYLSVALAFLSMRQPVKSHCEI